MKSGLIFAVLSVLWVQTAMGAEDKGGPSKAIGPCFTVHGRLSLYNGNPSVRIWIIGTKRLLGVVDYENSRETEHPVLPGKISEALRWHSNVFGDFVVCPVSRYKRGWMQFVYVKSARNLFYQNWEKQTFQILDKFLEKNYSYIDIGSWIGTTALYACQLSRHCYAIEPNPISFKELKTRI